MSDHMPSTPVHFTVRLAQVMAVLGAGALTWFIIWAGVLKGRNVITEGAAIAAMPWGVVALFDLYFGFMLVAAVILAFERRVWVGLAWVIPVFALGNVVTALWLALRLPAMARHFRR